MSAGRKTGYIRRAFLGLVFLVVVILVLAVLFRTIALETAGKAALNLYGFDEVSLVVGSVGINNILIDRLSLSDQIILKDVRVEYRPFSLLSAQIDEIVIGELHLDMSNPGQAALERISQIAGEDGSKGETDTARPYPEIQLQKGAIVAESAGFSLSGSLSGSFSSDQKLMAQSVLRARIDTMAGPVLLDDIQLSVDGDIAAQSGTVELASGALRHDVDRPDWAPLSLAGSGRLIDGIAEIEAALRTPEGNSLAQVEGRYVTEAENGEIQVSVGNLSFRRDGFQPSDLSRYADNLPLFDGTLNFTANAKIAGPEITYEADVDMNNLHMELNDGSVAAKRLPLEINGQYLMDDGSQDTRVALPASDVVLSYSGQEFTIKDLAASLSIINLAEMVELNSFSGTVTHNTANAYFSPMSFNASGEMKGRQEISATGAVRGESGKFELDVAAQYQIADGSGNVSLRLPPTMIGSGGIMPSKLSSFLKQADGLSGVVKAQAEAVREDDGSLIISSAHAELSKGRWTDVDIDARDLSVKVTAKQAESDMPIQGNIIGQAGITRFKEQGVTIPRLEAVFEAEHQNLQSVESALFTLSNLTIDPGEAAPFKERQIITGSGEIKGSDLDFSLDAKSDLLGSYLEVKGRHSLASSEGRAQVKVEPIFFAKDGLQLTDLVPFDAGLNLEGRVKPDAVLSWASAGLKSSADVLLENLSIKASGGSVSNLNGKVHIDELLPLTISAPQEITADSAVVGIPLENPVLRFRVLTEGGDPQLYIDRMALGLVGGVAVIDDAVIDTGAETNRIEVQLTSLDLEEVMALSNVEELVATGQVSGRVPLVFGGDRLIVDEALLAADGPGVLKMTSEAARRALEGGGDQAMLFLDILENFQYSDLSIEITKTQSGEDTVKLHAEGANPDVENSRPVVLNINLTTSLDKIFNTLLEGYLLSEKALRATVDGR